MSVSLLPKIFAQWIARRRAEAVADPAAKARQHLNILNVRVADAARNAGNPPEYNSTDRLNDGA